MEALATRLASLRSQVADLTALANDERKGLVKRWTEVERPALEQLIESLISTQAILKKEKKTLKHQLQQIVQSTATSADAEKKASDTLEHHDVVDLQTRLINYNNKLLDIDLHSKQVNTELASCGRVDERELLSTKLVCMQDTRRLVQREIEALRAEIFRAESAMRLQGEREYAEETGYAELARVEEHLGKINARIDRAKMSMTFPEIKGYRFCTGGSGVYLAAHDLFLSEVSGRFDVHCEKATRPNGSHFARLSISLGGVSASQDSSTSKLNEGQAAGGSKTTMRHSLSSGGRRSMAGNSGPQQPPHTATSLPAVSLPPSRSGSPSRKTHSEMGDHSEDLIEEGQAQTTDDPAAVAGTTGTSDSPSLLFKRLSVTARGVAVHEAEPPSSESLMPAPAAPQSSQAQQLMGLPPVPNPASIPLRKGEAVAGFLSNLSRKKDKSSPSGSGEEHGGQDRGGLALKARFGRLKDSLGGKMDRAKVEMAHAKDVMGDKVDKAKESLTAGMQESKGKLSKLAKAIATKAPAMRRNVASSSGSNHPDSPGWAMSTDPDLITEDGRAEGGTRGARRSVDDGSKLGLSEQLLSSQVKRESSMLSLQSVRSAQEPFLHETLSVASDLSLAAAAMDLSGQEQAAATQAALATSDFDTEPFPEVPSRGASSLEGGDAVQRPSAQLRPAQSSAPATPMLRPQPSLNATSVSSLNSSGGGAAGESASSNTTGAWGAAPGADAADNDVSVAFDEFEAQPARNGVYVQLLGEKVGIFGEKGTKVPNMDMRELLLEVEVVMSAVLEWNGVAGWQVSDDNPLELKILQLNHRMRGSAIPLPKAALKALLNLVLPSALRKAVLSALPPELGSYVVESGESLALSGEVRVLGHSLQTYVADLAPNSKVPEVSKRAKWQAQQVAAQRARSVLGLSDLQAQALSELFGGQYGLASPPSPVSVGELCHMYVTRHKSKLWPALCGLWNKGLQLVLDHYSAPPSERFTFRALMEGPVARLVRKPVRLTMTVDKVQLALDVDAGLNAVHDLFERLAREFHKKAQSKSDDSSSPIVPLDDQLSALETWHASLTTHLRTFKSRFRSASATLLAAADAQNFQAGAESVNYDGPLRARIPLDLATDVGEGSFQVDVSLPTKKQVSNSFGSVIQSVMLNLSSTVARDGDEAAARGTEGSLPPRRTASSQAVKEEEGHEEEEEQQAKGTAVPTPKLDNPVVGQLTARKLSLSLRLDEERVAELLAAVTQGDQPALRTGLGSSILGNDSAQAELLGTLMGCFGDLFTTSLDLGWRKDPNAKAARGATKPACMLTVANNEVTRVVATLDSFMFCSCVSPQLAVRVLNVVIIGLLTRWYSQDSYHVRFWQKLLAQVHEYLGKKSLDTLLCLSAHAEVIKPPTKPRGQQPAGSTGGSSAPGGAASTRLRVVLTGDRRKNPPGLTHVAPIHVVNDINLLTLMDSVKLLTETL